MGETTHQEVGETTQGRRAKRLTLWRAKRLGGETTQGKTTQGERESGRDDPLPPVMTRQQKPEETCCNFANFKKAVDSKTDINQNGVQIIKNLSRIWVQTNHLFLISQNIHADLKGPIITYKLHYGWGTRMRFTAATL